MAQLANHPILSSILRSLLLDTGNKIFPIGLRCFLAILPYAPKSMTNQVPLVMTITGRAACWRLRPFVDADSPSRDALNHTRPPIPSLDWSVATSEMEETMIPALQLGTEEIVRSLFVAVYNAWPSNLIAFLRDPVLYLKGKGFASVYDVEWEDVWEPGLLAARSGPLLRTFHLHPSLIYFTSATELADSKRWDKIDPSEFVSRSHMLAHSELLSDNRFDLMTGQTSPKWPPDDLSRVEADIPPPPRLGISSVFSDRQIQEELAIVRREVETLRLEAQSEDRIRKQYLYRG